MSEPERLRYGHVIAWLKTEGISEAEVRKLIEAGTIERGPLRRGGRNYYFRSQIQRDVLNGAAPTTKAKTK